MSSNGKHRLARAEKNEEAFKQHNERRADLEEDGGCPRDEPVPFVCECDDPACARALELPLEEYEHAVGPPDQFVVLPGHEDLSVERVIEQKPSYLVVSKPDLKRR
jgi:hypothetical protein